MKYSAKMTVTDDLQEIILFHNSMIEQSTWKKLKFTNSSQGNRTRILNINMQNYLQKVNSSKI